MESYIEGQIENGIQEVVGSIPTGSTNKIKYLSNTIDSLSHAVATKVLPSRSRRAGERKLRELLAPPGFGKCTGTVGKCSKENPPLVSDGVVLVCGVSSPH